MKELFGTNLTSDRRNTAYDGANLESAKLPASMQDTLDHHMDEVSDLAEKSEPAIPYIIETIAFLGWFICAGSLLRNLGELTFAEMFSNAPAIPWIMGISFVVWLPLFISRRIRKHRVENSEETAQTIDHAETTLSSCMQYLGVPADAVAADVLVYCYREKDGENILKERYGITASPVEVQLFRDDSCFHLCDGYVRYDIPLSDLLGIRQIHKRVPMNGWNKEDAPTAKCYKQYHMTTNNMEQVFIKEHFRLDFLLNGESFCLRFPPYELSVFQQMTGCSVSE